MNYRWPQAELSILVFVPLPSTEFYQKAIEMVYKPVRTLDYWRDYRHIKTEMSSALDPKKRVEKDGIIHFFQPERISSITPKQIKTLLRCQKYYFWYGAERLKQARRLNVFEKILNETSRVRLKNKLLGFPIEYKVYDYLRRLYAYLKSSRTFNA